MDDWQLLSEYVRGGSQAAFRQLVSAHVDLVYATCRRVVRDAHLAEDATQAVFVILAKKAHTLRRPTSLVGWLHNTARYVAANALRISATRRRHEMEAAQMPRSTHLKSGSSNSAADDAVDRALGRLDAQERDAVLLRFFEGRSFREVGAALSISEEAAKKRVWRAIEKLRQMLTPAGGASVTAATVAGLLAGANLPAPATLAVAAATAALTGTGAAISLAKGAVIAMAISKTKATAAAVALVILLTGGAAVVLNDIINPPRPVSQAVPFKPATQPSEAQPAALQAETLTTFLNTANADVNFPYPLVVAPPACNHLAKNPQVNNKTCTNCHNATAALTTVRLHNAALTGVLDTGTVRVAGKQLGLDVAGPKGQVLGDVFIHFTNIGLTAGADAPAIDLPGFDGKNIRLADLRGKYVLLHFWDSKTQPAREQLKHIHAAARDWANEPKLAIIGINLDEHFSAATAFAKEQQMTWPNAFAGVNSKLLADYCTGPGNSVLIDPDGKIVDPTLMDLEIDDLLDKTLRPQPK